jgi:pimeloyl-ACP methyl ester carboxylesterase
MGNLSDRATFSPQAVERQLPWGAVLRGLRWGNQPDVVLLLHEPGADIDAWAALPAEISRQLDMESVALDLPGHGLSDDPWEPARLHDLLRSLPDFAPASSRRFLIAAGALATAALEQAPALDLSGLVCLSPQTPEDRKHPPRSPRVAKLFVAGALAGSDLNDARRLSTECGGWAVVTSLPVTERGTSLLTSSWGQQLVAQTITFLRDCQRRPAPTNYATARPSPSPIEPGEGGRGMRARIRS